MQEQNINIVTFNSDNFNNFILEAVDNAVVKAMEKHLKEPEPADKLLTIKKTAEWLNVSRQTVWNHHKKGLLPAKKLGKRLLFSTREIEKVISNYTN